MAAGDTDLRAECHRLQQALALAERDRQLLGYEIHDGLVQDLAAAAMLLDGACRHATFASPESQEYYAGGLRLLHETIAKARRLIQNAAGVEISDVGIVAGLARLVEKFRVERGLSVSFHCDLPDLDLPASIQHFLLRIAQESLVNVWKHAQATAVEVCLSRQDGQLQLTIADNGVGFEPANAAPGHFGLAGIRARAAALGAGLVFDTAPNHGARVVVRLPTTVTNVALRA
jgi:signal transduction histidine kinase